MDKDTRNAIERATQRARKLLEEDFASQLEGTFDLRRDGFVAAKAGPHLAPRQVFQRDKIVAAIEHKRSVGMSAAEAVLDYLRDAAFTTLNRFVALKMLEARELVQECLTKGEQSAGYRELCGLAPGVALLSDSAGYRLYIESLFDELSTEVKVLFDRRDPASVLWPKRATFEALLATLNGSELASVWGEDETIGWVYQFFNSGDERKRMRDESQAPRNSRELAVRNQFFTPRYVVEFLVDNTLGRTWLQMHGKGSALAERCRYFVQSEAEPARARPRKDPRDLHILDPACGSGHFLLYCFDLLLTIYEEAWASEEPFARSHATGRTLRADYPDLGILRRATPTLILEHNLHGVDIDLRTTQIASLALWLRAQRAWKDFRVPASERPPVRRTHVVVAEPMPGDTALVDEFASRLNPPLLRDLFRKMVSEMRLAGELGTLIPVEEGIATELRLAREQFVKQRQSPGFLPGMEPVRKQGELDFSGIDDDHFFHEAETSLLKALRHFAEAAANGASVRRRLFAGDATQGIALIDLLRTRFDVVLMNPPFGAASLAAKREFEKAYPRTKNDIFAAFVERGIGLLHPRGLLGAITSRTGFFLSTFQKWREEILLKEAPPVVFADLGYGVMDAAMVEAAAYCLEKDREVVSTRSIFLRGLEGDDKQANIRACLEATRPPLRFELVPQDFRALPMSAFLYWLPSKVLQGFALHSPMSDLRIDAMVGAATTDDFRFVRAAWEVLSIARETLSWVPFAKGGAYSKFYFDIHLVLEWRSDARALKAAISEYRGSRGWGYQWSANLNGVEWYFRPGITWPRRSNRLSFRVMPSNCVFGNKGPAAFVPGDDGLLLMAMSACMNSSAFATFLGLQRAVSTLAQSYEVGRVQLTPIPDMVLRGAKAHLARYARRAWSLKRSFDTRIETSHAFTLPALLHVPGADIAARAAAWSTRVSLIEAELASIQAEIDERCFELYGIDEADRREIIEGFAAGTSEDSQDAGETDDTCEDDDRETRADAVALAAELVSWAVGVAFGRFDMRLTGTRSMPTEPEPFDPLPACSPGMLTGGDGLPLARPPAGYPVSFPETGVLVDDLGHPQDLTVAVRAVFDVVFGADADRWWNDIATLLDPKDHDLRVWLAASFFEHHLKRYSKSRRKAPILWQLGTSSGLYSVWLYAHRLTCDSFFQLQNEVVGPKLAHEERQLTRLIQNAGGSPSAKERKEIAEQEALVEELRVMLAEIKRVAPLWNPNLDDGVVLTMAPLWRLVPQYKPWQKELKAKWDELAAGKYDWAHLAMHLWPERVVPKCVTDRSLAIAHNLEDVFWVEGADGKWKARPMPLRSVEELVRERSSPAVKAALKSLLDAPTASGAGRARGRRAASSAGTEEGIR